MTNATLPNIDGVSAVQHSLAFVICTHIRGCGCPHHIDKDNMMRTNVVVWGKELVGNIKIYFFSYKSSWIHNGPPSLLRLRC